MMLHFTTRMVYICIVAPNSCTTRLSLSTTRPGLFLSNAHLFMPTLCCSPCLPTRNSSILVMPHHSTALLYLHCYVHYVKDTFLHYLDLLLPCSASIHLTPKPPQCAIYRKCQQGLNFTTSSPVVVPSPTPNTTLTTYNDDINDLSDSPDSDIIVCTELLHTADFDLTYRTLFPLVHSIVIR